jgi:hypothetical protein
VPESHSGVEKQSQIREKIIYAMQKHLDVSGVERDENNFQNAQLQARKKILTVVKATLGYLGNKLFFCPRGRLSAMNDAREEDQCRVTSLKSPIPAMES